MYWSLITTFECPCCGATNSDAELQTHWLGDIGSCLNRYRIGDRVAELRGITAAHMEGDSFVARCSACDCWLSYGAEVKDEAIISITYRGKEGT
jgi:hypothetical protein